MKERKTLKEIKSQHEDAIQTAIALVILAILTSVLFIGGYLVSWNFINEPLNDNQFKLCEQVARDVYAQKENVIVEIPENFHVNITKTTIIVKLDNNLYRGKVIAKLQNGKLVTMQDRETSKARFSSICIGILFVLVPFLIVAGAITIYKKIKEISGK